MKKSRFKIAFYLIVISIFFNACLSNKKKIEIDNENKLSELLSSSEYKNYSEALKNLSISGEQGDIEYVNDYMQNNKLWGFYNECDLLSNEDIKSDTRVYKFWESRCKFNIARQELENRFNIEPDSINKIIRSRAK
ncbi:MAG: hypothetical protein R2771_06775 [Saprospiraceae bacterium]